MATYPLDAGAQLSSSLLAASARNRSSRGEKPFCPLTMSLSACSLLRSEGGKYATMRVPAEA